MLPDCFGFVATLPQVLNHAGILGFSTMKLSWHSANGIPFNVGIWEGPDGSGLSSALNATDFGGHIVPRLDLDKEWNARLNDDIVKYGIPFDFRYYGVGDQGGSPRDEDVKNAEKSLNNSDSKFKVILTSSDQMSKDITPEIRKKLPRYSGDLLLIEHSAGSLTSQAYMKRANRRNEALAKSAEQLASTANYLEGISYPFNKINKAWNLVLGSQMHDILPGTAIPKAYEYAWNDEFVAMNLFSEVLKKSVSNISNSLNTMAKGKAVVVYNPVAIEREDIVTAKLSYTKLPGKVKVVDKDGNVVPSQIISAKDNALTLIFIAKLPSAGFSVFDIQETKEQPCPSELTVEDNMLENKYFKVEIDANGDIESIYDKKAKREVLSQPATLDFLYETPLEWPAWNMDWKDQKKPPFDHLNKNVTMKIVEKGPVRVAIEITRKGQNSGIVQVISLAAGDAGKVIMVNNKIDWQSKGVCLKAAFHTTVENEFASYGLNSATVERTTNNKVKFEVLGRKWIDITNRANNYGVSILEDCKYGSDKPDNNTLRLTLMYTPGINTKQKSHFEQGTQDWGIHKVKYGIYPHVGDWRYSNSSWQGEFINNPLIAFEATKHYGKLGKEFSMFSVNTSQINIMAFKKAELSDYYIVRLNELYGREAKNISMKFPSKIIDAYEVNGQERRIGDADFSKGRLNVNMNRFAIKSFAIRFKKPLHQQEELVQNFVPLTFNDDGFSSDAKRSDGNIIDGYTIPAELIPIEVVSEDIHFKMGNVNDREKNMLAANGQKIILPSGDFNKLYILAAATEDTQGTFKINGKTAKINFQKWTGFVGQHYNRVFQDSAVVAIKNAYTKRDNIAWFASHRHTPKGNDAYQYSYLYKYEIDVPTGAKSIILPDNSKIKIFAITTVKDSGNKVVPLQLLYDSFNGENEIKVSERRNIDLNSNKDWYIQY